MALWKVIDKIINKYITHFLSKYLRENKNIELAKPFLTPFIPNAQKDIDTRKTIST
jgi:hypothetical protein